MTPGRLAPALALALAAMGCGGGGGGIPDAAAASDTADGDTPSSFDDRTAPSFPDVDAFFAWSDLDALPVQAKFVLTDFSSADGGPAVYLDPSFYALHDEWYWFRLLNGEAIPGLDVPDVAPVAGLSFDSVAAVYETFAGLSTGEMPLDLTWVADGERLYSPAFYELSLWDEPRFFGIGSVLWFPPEPERVVPEELWLFELEFVDYDVDEAQLTTFFQRLEATLPPAVAPDLRWLARSPPQEALAAAIASGGGPYAARTLTYADLVVPGDVEAYNAGIVAGYVRRLRKGELGGSSVGPEDLVILEEVPDYLPPVAAIVTAVPQTPLAHLNLLAKSRGTPNVYVAGVFGDEALADWETWHKPAILKVDAEGVTWKLITAAEYQGYLDLDGVVTLTIPQVDLAAIPYTVDLAVGGLADVSGHVPITGGKSAGFLAFNDFPTIAAPPTPLAITIRSYAEHLAAYRPIIEGLLTDPYFTADVRVRFLVLEGEDDFAAEHAGDAKALAWMEAFLLQHHPETFLGSVVALGGLKRALRDWPLDATFEATLTSTLEAHFAALAPAQGLRFRSSSTAEDVQGFNGAGLYDSNTGYLHPELQPADQQKRTVAWALLKTWASYWSFEAFEERRLAGIDHLSGNMGVLVHPRFDDPLEAANGVITLFLAREPAGARRAMIVNVQDGAVSVTNPDPADPTAPEIVEVSAIGGAAPAIDRVQPSSLVAPGAVVLDDAQLLELFAWTDGLTAAWLDQVNTAWPPAQQRSTLVLDFEFKRMAAGWPALASGELLAERTVLKQVRTLDSAIRAPDEVQALPVPRDLLEQVDSAAHVACTAAADLTVAADLFWTDPAQDWALDYAVHPLVATLEITLSAAAPALGLDAGHQVTLDHTHLVVSPLGAGDELAFEAALSPEAAATAGFDAVRFVAGGEWRLAAGAAEAAGDGLACTSTAWLASPGQYLQTLLDAD